MSTMGRPPKGLQEKFLAAAVSEPIGMETRKKLMHRLL